MTHDLSSESLTFAAQIKQATAASHEALEALPLSASILSPSLNIPQYAHYLSLMSDVVRDAELNISPLATTVFKDLDDRKKLGSLLVDLENAGAPKTVFKPVFRHDISLPFALGILYVVEGSVLGGRFILKNITATTGFDGTDGATYFHGYGNSTGMMWKRFMDALSSYADEHQQADEIIAGADYAFKAIHEHFSQQQ